MTNIELARKILEHVQANRHSRHLDVDIANMIGEAFPIVPAPDPDFDPNNVATVGL